jgi:hypothetical protein
VAALAATIARRVERLLARRGLREGDGGGEASDPWADDEPVRAGLSAAAVSGVAALGPCRRTAIRRWGDTIDLPEALAPGPWRARHDRFDFPWAWGSTPTPSCSSASLVARAAGALHAGVVVRVGARERLERLCRYALRPPVGQDRVQSIQDGTVVLELPRRWTDGTTHLIFEPVELLESLAALVPRPRVNLVLYDGVLAPRAAWRRVVVPATQGTAKDDASSPGMSAMGVGPGHADSAPNRTCAELMQRSFHLRHGYGGLARRSGSRSRPGRTARAAVNSKGTHVGSHRVPIHPLWRTDPKGHDGRSALRRT